MTWIIVTIIAVILTVGAAIASKNYKKGDPGYSIERNMFGGAAIFLAILWLGYTSLRMFYTQDPGQASVLVSFTGSVQGINYEAGLHAKAPWDSRISYDIRNNTLAYVGTNGTADNYIGGDVSGPQITFQDANGVSGNIDVNVRYSIRGDAVGEIYTEYKTQQEFVNSTIAPDTRATVRAVLAGFQTSQVYGDRDKIQSELFKTLSESWNKLGVDIEEVYLQEVRYPESVTNSFADAQAARTAVETAKANQEKARVEAETNRIKSDALTDAVLKEKLIDAIKNGNGTYVLGDAALAIGAN